jgi:hypothetical protein
VRTSSNCLRNVREHIAPEDSIRTTRRCQTRGCPPKRLRKIRFGERERLKNEIWTQHHSKFFIFTVSRVYGFKIEVYGLLENRVNLED